MFNSDEEMTYTWNSIAPGSIITNGSINGGTIVTGNSSTTGPGNTTITWPNANTSVGGLTTSNPSYKLHANTSQILSNKPTVFIKNTSAVCSKIKYVIIQQNGDMLELVEKKSITPREMIGISKFLNMVTIAITPGAGMRVNWTALIRTLKIENHFEKPSVVITNPTPSSDVLEIQLHDSI